MSDEWNDIPQKGIDEEDEMNELPIEESEDNKSAKFDKLTDENVKKFKLSGMFREWLLDYS